MAINLFPDSEIYKPPAMKVDMEKLAQVLLYVLHQTSGKQNVGETVLNKLLYFIDFDFYELHTRSLTGETYMKNRYGPTSKNLVKLLREMEQRGQIKQTKQTSPDYVQHKFTPLVECQPDFFSPQELDHMDDVIGRLGKMNAKALTDYSHEDIPYLAADMMENLRYKTVFYREDDYSARLRNNVL